MAKKMAAKKSTAKKKTTKKPSTRKTAQNFAVWFEIPVSNMERAMKFYSKVFGIKMESGSMGQSSGAMFPFAPNMASGALILSKENKPCNYGSMIYLNGGDNLLKPLKRVIPAGGKIVQAKVSIGEYGYMAIFEDTEGNHVALHSMK